MATRRVEVTADTLMCSRHNKRFESCPCGYHALWSGSYVEIEAPDAPAAKTPAVPEAGGRWEYRILTDPPRGEVLIAFDEGWEPIGPATVAIALGEAPVICVTLRRRVPAPGPGREESPKDDTL